MYLLTYNAESNEIQAGIGGVITRTEGQVLIEELEALFQIHNGGPLSVELDTTKVTRFSDGAEEEIERFHFVCSSKGINLVSVKHDEDNGEMSPNVRAILEGQSSELFELQLAA